jgi:hypothetical protein
MVEEKISVKEKRIRKITQLYYSRPDVQKNIFEFCKNREISPRYFEGFGKRPDTFQFKADVFGLAKKGATSFHCSQELWEDPLKIVTGMSEKESNEIRIGWDLLIDIDCKWFDYTKLAAKSILETLKRHGVKNVGIKFSGSKGFHLLVPWKAFPKEINGIKTKNLFPELPRKIAAYLKHYSEKIFEKNLPEGFSEQFKKTNIKTGKKCKKCNNIAESFVKIELYCPFCRIGEIRKFEKNSERGNFSCPECGRKLVEKSPMEVYECSRCNTSSDISDIKKEFGEFSEYEEKDLFSIMGLDIVLVSPRHLFRTPYSLHEKTALASVVLNEKELEKFTLKDADPMKVKIKNFDPNPEEGEAAELVMQALDWAKTSGFENENGKSASGRYANFKPIKLNKILEKNFPPCIKKILQGMGDGKKRALFALINFFRSIGMEKNELEKKIYEWNEKQETPLKKGYVHSQLTWSYRRKPVLPPNCKEFYRDLGVCFPDQTCSRIKNPVNYIIRKSFIKKSNKKETH